MKTIVRLLIGTINAYTIVAFVMFELNVGAWPIGARIASLLIAVIGTLDLSIVDFKSKEAP